MSARLFIVMLRRPRKDDQRTDPFWEFGSFGCTGCHGKNLLHPKNCQIRNGDRLAFVQGGQLGARLLLVTPPVERFDHAGGSPKGCVELRWDSGQKPFRYDQAPSLFESLAPSNVGLFPQLADSLAPTNRSTIDAKLASRFRARTSPLEPELARELETAFNAAMKRSGKSDFIAHYDEALPWCDCSSSASERKRDYQQKLRKLKNVAVSQSRKKSCCK
ncbi:MAG: hypothetical protein HY360_11665 [Verrucomicrobia bacterium]|nr:hypothetical protein [Verrucomicrobiota bacterium]